MDLSDQLKNLFPKHEFKEDEQPEKSNIWLQDQPLECKFEKRKGKVNTVIDGYTGAIKDFKILAKELKTQLGVGGSFKNDQIIIQGDYRDRIMEMLKEKGFKVKRVGG
ncbi:translation initiation factor SUI1-related protein [Nonlabens sp. MB-3u-79]|uniref:translation initiation factor n=1 Tax=Nonlabens sp. MB-3u-79 TaxID=2058134 RepID=UPI000C31939D|nr:translation initiation factor [Nonlabens sp. MB-3u-79]AUC79668.1 translation initiation factor SUI1-related protein [Nonlabens sp. MB-3u-79]